jgi:enoyl-CoA hydratase/carnithine racemase
MSARAHSELGDVFSEVGRDETTKVVIITGTGDTFCVLRDIPARQDNQPASYPSFHETWVEGTRLLNSLIGIGVPVISAVNGPATYHAEIALFADIVLASETAVFADKAHFIRGIVPGDGVHVAWIELLGRARAKYFLMTGEEIDANEAQRLGVVSEVLHSNELEDRAWSLAATIAKHPLPVLRYTRMALNLGMHGRVAESVSHGLALEGLGLSTGFAW